MRALYCSILLLLLSGCGESPDSKYAAVKGTSPYIVVLGTAQDAGAPQIGCEKACCSNRFENPALKKKVVSLGLVDPKNNTTFLFEATPDIPEQLNRLAQHTEPLRSFPKAIFLTHAHMGHYSGLMHLGKEAANANGISVFAMPRMFDFLSENGPWDQMVKNKNIVLEPAQDSLPIVLSENLSVIPFKVPHRDEYSETVGFKIIGPTKKLLFIPDIDKWSVWATDIVSAVKGVDYALIDATFFDGAEINHRDISEIPHPFVVETLERFKDQPPSEKSKVHFIHFNHTNPLLVKESTAFQELLEKGYNISEYGQIIGL